MKLSNYVLGHLRFVVDCQIARIYYCAFLTVIPWVMASRLESSSISLLDILKSTNKSLTEAETWAVAYQAAKSAESCFESGYTGPFFTICNPSQLLFNPMGMVDAKSFFYQNQSKWVVCLFTGIMCWPKLSIFF